MKTKIEIPILNITSQLFDDSCEVLKREKKRGIEKEWQ